MAAEARVDDQLLLVVGLCELEEEDARREVVDVGDAEAEEALVELVGDDLEARDVSSGFGRGRRRGLL